MCSGLFFWGRGELKGGQMCEGKAEELFRKANAKDSQAWTCLISCHEASSIRCPPSSITLGAFQRSACSHKTRNETMRVGNTGALHNMPGNLATGKCHAFSWLGDC